MPLFRRRHDDEPPDERFDTRLVRGSTDRWPDPRPDADREPDHPDRIPDHVDGPFG